MKGRRRMRHLVLGGLAALSVSLAAGSSWAHHSITALFDVSKSYTLSGVLTKVDWRNPHSELSLEVRNDHGELEAWVIQAASLSWFTRRSLGKSDFENAIGQTVTVDVFRARDGNLWGALLKITFANGAELRSNPTQ